MRIPDRVVYNRTMNNGSMISILWHHKFRTQIQTPPRHRIPAAAMMTPNNVARPRTIRRWNHAHARYALVFTQTFRICANICDWFIIQHRFVARYVKSHSHPISISSDTTYRCMAVQSHRSPAPTHNQTIQIHLSNCKRHNQHHNNKRNQLKHNNNRWDTVRILNWFARRFGRMNLLIFLFIAATTSTTAFSWSKACKSHQSDAVPFICQHTEAWIQWFAHKYHTSNDKSGDRWWQTDANVPMGLWCKQSRINFNSTKSNQLKQSKFNDDDWKYLAISIGKSMANTHLRVF